MTKCPSSVAEPTSGASVDSESLQQQFDDLRETQAATLADLDLIDREIPRRTQGNIRPCGNRSKRCN